MAPYKGEVIGQRDIIKRYTSLWCGTRGSANDMQIPARIGLDLNASMQCV